MSASKKRLIILLISFLALIAFCILLTLAAKKIMPQLRSWVEQQGRILGKEKNPLVGQIGGRVLTCSIHEGYAYAGVGHHLVILDIHDPAKPVVTGQTGVLPSPVDNVLIRDGYALTANEQGGVHFVDLSDPTAPVDKAWEIMIGDASAMTLAGEYAYILNQDGLEIIDVSDSANPVRVSSFMPSTARLRAGRDIVVSGDYAYIADYFNGLLIVQIADPTRPTEAGWYTHEAAENLTASGDYLYVLSAGKLDVFSLANPLSPTKVTTYDSTLSFNDIAISGEYAYLAADGGIQVLGISDPTRLVEISFYQTDVDVANIDVSEGLACLAMGTAWMHSDESYLQIISVTNPEELAGLGVYQPPVLAAQAIALADHYIYLVDTTGNLHIVDTATLATPREIGFYHVAQSISDVSVSGHYAYVTGDLGLYVLDIDDPTRITQVAVYSMTERADHVVLASNNAYVTGDGLLQIIDLMNPLAPALVGVHDLYGATGQLAVDDGKVYLAARKSGLRIFDISNPTAISEVGHFDMNATDVFLSGETAYVTSGDFGPGVSGGLHVIDVSDPASPTEKSVFESGGPTGNVFVSEGYAYIASSGNGLKVYNLAVPPFLSLVGHYSPPAHNDVNDVIVSGDYVYVTDSFYGLFILNKAAILQ